jgi:prolyl-tRNA synthetase
VAGANEVGYHYKNVNYERDFQVDLINDFALANAGCCCPKCRNKMSTAYGIEVGHIFKLGKFMSEKMGAYFLNSNGANESITMGCYGIGLGRLLAAVIERSHDDKGIIWPFTIAPYQVYLCALSLNQPEIAAASEDLYNKLIEAGITVLFDDREESAGIKFNDADLMGMPIRLTISKRTLKQDSVEFKFRYEKNSQLVPLEKLISFIQEMIAEQSAS